MPINCQGSYEQGLETNGEGGVIPIKPTRAPDT